MKINKPNILLNFENGEGYDYLEELYEEIDNEEV